jgi:hypothetical protein
MKNISRSTIISIILFVAFIAIYDGFAEGQRDRKAKIEQNKNIEKPIIAE